MSAAPICEGVRPTIEDAVTEAHNGFLRAGHDFTVSKVLSRGIQLGELTLDTVFYPIVGEDEYAPSRT